MSVHNKLQDIFRQVFEDEDLELQDGMTAADVAKWNSVNHINLIFAIEQEFEVQFSESELERLTTVGALKQLLAAKAPILDR